MNYEQMGIKMHVSRCQKVETSRVNSDIKLVCAFGLGGSPCHFTLLSLTGQYTAFSYSHPLINSQERTTLMHDKFIVNAKGLYRPVLMPLGEMMQLIPSEAEQSKCSSEEKM